MPLLGSLDKWYLRHRLLKVIRRIRKEPDMMEKLKSRKLWITILGAILGVVYPPAIPLLKLIVPTYIAGQSVVDAAAAIKS